MKTVFQLNHCALGAVLLCAAVGSSALTLGRARGAALLGQPLQITVPLQLAADEDASGACFEADVFYGEVRQESTRVSVTPERNAAGQPTALRIQARTPVDEPVVSIYLRSACGVSTSRRYVLLADLVSETVPAVVPSGSAQLTRPSAALPSAERLPFSTPVAVEAGNGTVVPTPTAKPVPVPAVPAKRTTSRAEAAQPIGKTPATGRPRLKLAPLDLSQDWEPALKSSSELLVPPVEDLQKRLAAAALWKTLNLTPEEVLQDAARLQGLEQNVSKLSEQTAQNQRQMQSLLARLEKSESERYANPLVYALVLALLALVGGMVWLWRRLRNAGDAPWWRGQGDSQLTSLERETTAQDNIPAAHPPLAAAPVAVMPPPAKSEPAVSRKPLTDVDIDLHLDELSPPAPVVTPTASAPLSSRMMGLRDFSPSMSGSLRSINTQEVLDVRQQADFFMTLGQYDDAIALLEHNIADHAESNPLVYLDLLKALHTLSRKAAFDRYREEFNALFTGEVPAYNQFNQAGQGLEMYPELCAHIASVWPSRAALEFIEKCLVRDPNAAAEVRFDLEAFRELLLLHALLTRLSGEATSGVAPFSTAKSAEPLLPTADTGPVPVDAALPATDIDLDLSESVPAQDNLIEFDASGLSSLTPPLTPRR